MSGSSRAVAKRLLEPKYGTEWEKVATLIEHVWVTSRQTSFDNAKPEDVVSITARVCALFDFTKVGGPVGQDEVERIRNILSGMPEVVSINIQALD